MKPSVCNSNDVRLSYKKDESFIGEQVVFDSFNQYSCVQLHTYMTK